MGTLKDKTWRRRTKTTKKLNFERITKFEDKSTPILREGLSCKQQKRQNEETDAKDEKGSQQSTLDEVSMMLQQQIHQESKTHQSTRAPSMQTQLPKQKTVKGQTLKEESMKMRQTECEARRRMLRTKQSREKPQPLQQDHPYSSKASWAPRMVAVLTQGRVQLPTTVFHSILLPHVKSDNDRQC